MPGDCVTSWGLVMRKLLLSALGFVALSGVGEAGAADLPVKAASLVPAAPVFSWSGLYFGASVGAQWFNSESSYVYPGGTDSPSSGSATLNNTNAMIAFQFGRNLAGPGIAVGVRPRGGLDRDQSRSQHHPVHLPEREPVRRRVWASVATADNVALHGGSRHRGD